MVDTRYFIKLCHFQYFWEWRAETHTLPPPKQSSFNKSQAPSCWYLSRNTGSITDSSTMTSRIFKRLLGSSSQHLLQICQSFLIVPGIYVFRGLWGCFPSMIASMTRTFLVSWYGSCPVIISLNFDQKIFRGENVCTYVYNHTKCPYVCCLRKIRSFKVWFFKQWRIIILFDCTMLTEKFMSHPAQWANCWISRRELRESLRAMNQTPEPKVRKHRWPDVIDKYVRLRYNNEERMIRFNMKHVHLSGRSEWDSSCVGKWDH